MLPMEIAGRMVDGENLVKIRREYRGMTISAPAEQAGAAGLMFRRLKVARGTAQSPLTKSWTLPLKQNLPIWSKLPPTRPVFD